jgi:hypothetical protein
MKLKVSRMAITKTKSQIVIWHDQETNRLEEFQGDFNSNFLLYALRQDNCH